jgi:hypothetical protein
MGTYSSSKELALRTLKLRCLECLLMVSLSTDSAAILSDSSAPGAAPTRTTIS